MSTSTGCVLGMMLTVTAMVLGMTAGAAPEVTISQGVVRGLTATSLRGREYFTYKGIPYAKPPVNELRFQPPQPVDAGNATILAFLDGDFCVQKNYFLQPPSTGGSEDCLTINVYTPRVVDASLPVMVWIHGGGWFAGSGASYITGPDYLLDKDVVVVSFNYRLGVFGFLSTGDAAAPGNYGMKDQVAALSWVRDNIRAFGGNPNNVTLFGQSAGAASVHLHMFSESSTGLFHRAISESASALSMWAWPQSDPIGVARQLASAHSCPQDSSQQLIDCLRTVDATSLTESGDMFHFWSIDPMTTYAPVVEDPSSESPFLTDHPLNLVQQDKFNKVPWLCGVVAQEGILRGQAILSDSTLLSELNSNWTTIGPRLMELWKSVGDDADIIDNIWTNITAFYFTDQLPVTEANGLNLIDLISDRFFMHGIHKSTLVQAAQGHDSIYMYSFNYRGLNSYANFFAYNPINYGISHNDDLIYLFKGYGLFPDWPSHHPDLKMVDSLVTLWTNFAIYGTPTPAGDVTSTHVTCDLNSNTTDDKCDLSQLSWTPVPTVVSPDQSQLTTSYLNIYVGNATGADTLNFAMETDFFKERMSFWDGSQLMENMAAVDEMRGS